ncbi:unnamed protein product, partial [Prorocentrum cordatum]
VGLTAGDQSVIDHEFCCRLLQLAVGCDQLSITELACMELVSRKLHVCEYRHRERAIGAAQGDELLEDAHLYPGVGETRGLAMVSPSLLSYFSKKLKTEAAILNERRKMREERAEHQASASSRGGKGGQAALQSLVDKQRSEITVLKAQIATPRKAGSKREGLGRPPGGKRGRRRRAVQNAFINSSTSECLAAVNWLYGKEGSPDFNSLSLAQRAGALDLRRRLAALGPPPVSLAAALRELRRPTPGCLDEPAKPATFSVDSIALPPDDAKCKPGEHLDASCTIALLFVAKSDGGRRLVLDARKVNSYLHDPPTVELPTAGAWSGLRTREGDELVVEQVDIEAAFYRVEAPVGLAELMAVPSVLVSDLLKLDLSLPVEMVKGERAAPPPGRAPHGVELVPALLPRVVPSHVLKAGFREQDMISDEHVVKDVARGPAVAAYVDGAVVVGVDRKRARDGIAAVERELEASALRCKGIATTADEQSFTGLVFLRGTGEVRLSSSRLWKMRLALLELASQKYVSGRAAFQLVGHYNWAALLRGPLLSVFSAAYRYARKVGDNVWRPRPDVAAELRAAGVLLGLAYLDARRPIDPLVTNANASSGDGDPEGALFGGFG